MLFSMSTPPIMHECVLRMCNSLNFDLERARPRSVILLKMKCKWRKEVPRNSICIGQRWAVFLAKFLLLVHRKTVICRIVYSHLFLCHSHMLYMKAFKTLFMLWLLISVFVHYMWCWTFDVISLLVHTKLDGGEPWGIVTNYDITLNSSCHTSLFIIPTLRLYHRTRSKAGTVHQYTFTVKTDWLF